MAVSTTFEEFTFTCPLRHIFSYVYFRKLWDLYRSWKYLRKSSGKNGSVSEVHGRAGNILRGFPYQPIKIE